MIINTIEAIKAKDVDYILGLSEIKESLPGRIKHYKKRAVDIERYLSKRPGEWGRFQSEFNAEINGVFSDIMHFEKINHAQGTPEKPERLRRLFVNKVRDTFMRGVYIEWSLRKPFGYAGDFKIIDDIYRNDPISTGFDRLFDNYFQMSSISVAVRNRKEDFKRILINLVNGYKEKPVRIMDLASGPCRDVKELLASDRINSSDVIFDCYDSDENSAKYARELLGDAPNVNFIEENVIRMAAAKNIRSRISERYDIIYSTGLFDYLGYKISMRLVQNLKKLLKSGGVLAIADIRDKYSNPSVHFMEWVGEWNLIYREDDDFRQIFIDAGFRKDEIVSMYEQQGIIQYIIATNRGK